MQVAGGQPQRARLQPHHRRPLHDLHVGGVDEEAHEAVLEVLHRVAGPLLLLLPDPRRLSLPALTSAASAALLLTRAVLADLVGPRVLEHVLLVDGLKNIHTSSLVDLGSNLNHLLANLSRPELIIRFQMRQTKLD